MPDSTSLPPLAVVVMGVDGTGKSTVARRIADQLNGSYVHAHDLNPASNVAKMRAGTPLSDEDRGRWFDRLRTLLAEHISAGSSIVLACSALREEDRERLQPEGQELQWIFLQADRELLASRLPSNSDPKALTCLDAQLAMLEVPDPNEALWCNVIDPPETIVQSALNHLTALTV